LAYYDPTSWIDKNDSLISDVEDRVEAEKTCSKVPIKTGFVPPNCVEMKVIVKETNETLCLREWQDTIGTINIVLSSLKNIIFRQGHFNNSGHRNPNRAMLSPPHHIHFPTQKFPDLSKRPAYAYEVSCDNDYISALTRYCEDCNIGIQGIHLTLFRRS
jgi:hypothetical protein